MAEGMADFASVEVELGIEGKSLEEWTAEAAVWTALYIKATATPSAAVLTVVSFAIESAGPQPRRSN